MAGNEDNVWGRPKLPAVCELPLEVQSVDVRKLHIQNETRRYVWFRMCEVLRSGIKRDHVQSEG